MSLIQINELNYRSSSVIGINMVSIKQELIYFCHQRNLNIFQSNLILNVEFTGLLLLISLLFPVDARPHTVCLILMKVNWYANQPCYNSFTKRVSALFFFSSHRTCKRNARSEFASESQPYSASDEKALSLWEKNNEK